VESVKMLKGQIVEIDKSYRAGVFKQKYGVVSTCREDNPVVVVTVPLENGMRVLANMPKYALKPVTEEEVKL
jgi:hypothetical protein